MRRLSLLLVALGLVAAGCGGGDGISAEKPWARNSPMMAEAGAAYMQLTSDEADTLIGVSVDASIAGKAEIHETVPVDEGMADDSTEDMSDDSMEGMGGAMMMREVGHIALPAGETVSLEPGGYHIMLMKIATPLEVGQKFDVTLTFENGGEKVVEIEVREEAP